MDCVCIRTFKCDGMGMCFAGRVVEVEYDRRYTPPYVIWAPEHIWRYETRADAVWMTASGEEFWEHFELV